MPYLSAISFWELPSISSRKMQSSLFVNSTLLALPIYTVGLSNGYIRSPAMVAASTCSNSRRGAILYQKLSQPAAFAFSIKLTSGIEITTMILTRGQACLIFAAAVNPLASSAVHTSISTKSTPPAVQRATAASAQSSVPTTEQSGFSSTTVRK